MKALDQYIASRGLQNAPAGNPMGNVAQISPELIALLPNLLKGVGAGAAGVLGDFASMPLAAYTSGFSMGNGQYPGKVMSNVPGATDWLGEKMGADVNSPAFMLGSTLTPDVTDIGHVAAAGAKLAGNYPALNAMLAGMTAWHGGPHKFDKFDISKIGTGEGAQAYGHGLYFAESKDVAKQYAPRDLAAEEKVMRLYKSAESKQDYEAMEIYENALMHKDADEILEIYTKENGYDDSMIKKAQQATKKLRGIVEQGTYIYNVDIPDEAIAKMLDWDKPLSADVVKMVQEVSPGYFSGGMPNASANITQADAYYHLAEKLGSDEAASKFLNSKGIPGIRYLDGSSRSAGEGTRNFVVFDDKIPKVISRNGEKLNK